MPLPSLQRRQLLALGAASAAATLASPAAQAQQPHKTQARIVIAGAGAAGLAAASTNHSRQSAISIAQPAITDRS